MTETKTSTAVLSTYDQFLQHPDIKNLAKLLPPTNSPVCRGIDEILFVLDHSMTRNPMTIGLLCLEGWKQYNFTYGTDWQRWIHANVMRHMEPNIPFETQLLIFSTLSSLIVKKLEQASVTCPIDNCKCNTGEESHYSMMDVRTQMKHS